MWTAVSNHSPFLHPKNPSVMKGKKKRKNMKVSQKKETKIINRQESGRGGGGGGTLDRLFRGKCSP